MVVQVDGRPQVIEYSDLPAELAERREPDGEPPALGRQHRRPRPGAVVRRAAGRRGRQAARSTGRSRRSPFVDANGEVGQARRPQRREVRAVHLRRPAAGRAYALVETDRAVEFEPLKNATGPDSPATVRQRMSDQFADWLEAAGARVDPAVRRLGPVRDRDQPAVRPRRRRAEVEDRARPGRRRAALPGAVGRARSDDRDGQHRPAAFAPAHRTASAYHSSICENIRCTWSVMDRVATDLSERRRG